MGIIIGEVEKGVTCYLRLLLFVLKGDEMLVAKIVFLFVGVFFTLVNITRAHNGDRVPPLNFIGQAAGITGFAVLQWLI